MTNGLQSLSAPEGGGGRKEGGGGRKEGGGGRKEGRKGVEGGRMMSLYRSESPIQICKHGNKKKMVGRKRDSELKTSCRFQFMI